MFTFAEREFLARKVEEAIKELKDSGIDKEKPKFFLFIQGIDPRRYETIHPNWQEKEFRESITPLTPTLVG
jgi:hypothetical protein